MRCFCLMTLLLLSLSIETSKGRNMINRFSGWSTWETISSCSVTCGSGTVTRTRECIGNPKFCVGNKIGFRTCKAGCCPVIAEWCEWSSWSMCAVGLQMRTRECGCPVAREGGALCEGNVLESRSCPMELPASREDYESDGQLVGLLTIADEIGLPHDMGSGDGFEYGQVFAGGDADVPTDDGTEFYTYDYDYGKHENNDGNTPTVDYPYDVYNENERERHKTQEPSPAMTDVDYECNNFREVMKENQEKANTCCDVWKNFVSSTNDTLFELATHEKQLLNEGPSQEETVNSPLSSVLASFEFSNQGKNEVNEDPKPDYDDHFVSTSPQATSEIISMKNMSELEHCLSKSMDNPGAISIVVMTRGAQSKCAFPRNIIRTVCCAYRHCYSWKHAGLRGACSECRDARHCFCNGVPLSG